MHHDVVDKVIDPLPITALVHLCGLGCCGASFAWNRAVFCFPVMSGIESDCSPGGSHRP